MSALQHVVLETNLGKITLEIDTAKTPKTAENFLRYVREGFYTDTIFHRVIPGFVIQGGGFSENMREKSTQPAITNEAATGSKNLAYHIAMARTNAPHSATSQFFINLADNAFLDFKSETPSGYGYCAFGRVIEGQAVVDEIATASTKSYGGHDDVPVQPIVIQKASIVDLN